MNEDKTPKTKVNRLDVTDLDPRQPHRRAGQETVDVLEITDELGFGVKNRGSAPHERGPEQQDYHDRQQYANS